MHHPIFVLNPNGDKVRDTHRAEADRMVALKQAKYMANGRGLRLLGFTREHEHPCRTHTSRGGPLGGQQYTTSTHGRVDGFKRIFLEDRGFFNAATLECFKALKPAGPVWYIDGSCAGAFQKFLIEVKAS